MRRLIRRSERLLVLNLKSFDKATKWSCYYSALVQLSLALGVGLDPSSGIGVAEFGQQMGDQSQFLTPSDIISQRSSPDFMPGGSYSPTRCFAFTRSRLFARVCFITSNA